MKSEALTEPYISSMKKLGLVVTGASHFVGIADFVKICRYFHVEPPGILTKYCNVTSEIDPEAVLRSFSGTQTFGSLTGDDSVNRVTGSTLNLSGGVTSLLGGGGGVGEGERPSSRGSGVSGDISSSPHANASEEGVCGYDSTCVHSFYSSYVKLFFRIQRAFFCSTLQVVARVA